MPAAKVGSVEEFFSRLDETQRPHLTRLRELCLAGAEGTGVTEELKYNFPAYTLDNGKSRTMVWTLQCFKNHCSIRFPVSFFGPYRDRATQAGYEAIEGALKIRWDQEVPAALITELISDRIDDFKAGNTAWSTPGQYAGKKK